MKLLEGLETASLDEKLSALETLVISIHRDQASSGGSPPDWHGEVLQKRKAMIESGGATWIPLEEAKARALEKYRK